MTELAKTNSTQYRPASGKEQLRMRTRHSFHQHTVKPQVIRGWSTEENAATLIPAVHAAQVEIVNAAEVAPEIEGVAPDSPQPAGQCLQVEAVLPGVITRLHVSS